MHECKHNPGFLRDTLIPQVGVITGITQETPDVKTFRVNAPEGGKLFEHMPGQCAMVCVPGVSEAMFSITSSPTNRDYQEFSIKKCGQLTDVLHSLQVGDRPRSLRQPLPSGRRPEGKEPVIHRRRHRPGAPAVRHQLRPGQPGKLRDRGYPLRLPVRRRSGKAQGD